MPEVANKSDYYVGVDLGGTKIYAGVFNHALEVVGTARISTKRSEEHTSELQSH